MPPLTACCSNPIPNLHMSLLQSRTQYRAKPNSAPCKAALGNVQSRTQHRAKLCAKLLAYVP